MKGRRGMRSAAPIRVLHRQSSGMLVLLCTFSLAGCDNGEARRRADCAATQQLYRKIITAMCTPWGERRSQALADLVIASRNENFEEIVSEDLIRDMASDVSSKECSKFGLGNPGPLPADPEEEARRRRRAHIPPPPQPSEEVINSLRKSTSAIRPCKLLEP